MKSEKELLRQKITTYKLAGIPFAIGVGFLYLVFAVSDMDNYPLVRISAGSFGMFALISGTGIWMKKAWAKWTLLMLLFSMYLMIGAVHLATGETSKLMLGFVFIGIPVTAYLFWRTARKVLDDAA